MTAIEPEPLPAGFQLSHYVVESELRSGRMGHIYKATDTTLDEAVAINVLAANLRNAEGVATFRGRSARAFRRHRGEVHEYGEWEGIPFVVLAYPGEAGSVVDICDE